MTTSNSLAQCIQDTCCGTTCDKQELVKRVAELEKRCKKQQEELDEFYDKEEFAHKCFRAGYESDHNISVYKSWLNFKSTEL